MRRRIGAALLLAGVAGSVDAVGYLNVLHLFLAHMSGNSVRVGIDLAERSWSSLVERALPIPLLLAGVMAGGAITELGLRRKVRAIFSVLLSLEVLLLIGFALVATFFPLDAQTPAVTGWRFYLLVALPTLAMGVQNASLRRIGGHPVRTTFVTGMLIDLGESIVALAFWWRDRRAGGKRERFGERLRAARADDKLDKVGFYLSLWLVYAAGAAAGAFGNARWHLGILVVPILLLTLLAIANLFRPMLPPRPQ